MSDREPVFNAPLSCIILLCLMLFAHLLQLFGIIDAAVYSVQPQEFWRAPLALHSIVTLFTYQFLHAGWLHLGVNTMMLLAFGSGMIRIVGSARFIIFYLVTGMLAALAHLLIYPESDGYLIGASGAISGAMGFVLWRMIRQPRKRMQLLFAIIITQLILMASGSALLGGDIAWAAHLAGFAVGIAASLVLRHKQCQTDR